MMNITPVVKQLLILNIIFFIGSQIPSTHAYDLFALYFPESINFRYWQILTHMFMHAPVPNIMHIAFNMFALFSFGSALEQFWGGKKFLFFYISCGIGAALLHIGVNYMEFHKTVDLLISSGVKEADIYSLLAEGKYDKDWGRLIGEENLGNYIGTVAGTVVGASGAIYGLLTAFAFMFPKAELMMMFIPIPIKAKYFVPGLLVLDLFLGLRGSSIFAAGSTGIAHFAHIGGALTGFIMMWFWKKNQFNHRRWN
ncbi:MAG: rhomboid family intramembrane serine protease [Flavobacteriales bacterium]|nr:rhomboid family intramembrane serine protease [Flavobacteriales bacterium]